jgi:ubiquinone/menaquinone biosynthesis C-methylase UbiE
MKAASEDIKTGIDILRQFLVPRTFTLRLVDFAQQEGILSLMNGMKIFTKEEFCDRAAVRLKYKTGDRARKRMLFILLDFLKELDYISPVSPTGGQDSAHKCNNAQPLPALSPSEEKALKEGFASEVEFFGRCIDYAGEFLRGGDYLYNFTQGMEDIWDRFLGNYEFSIARDILFKAMASDKTEDCQLLDLCYGTGHGLKAICRDFPNAGITAIDFTGAMRQFTISRLGEDFAKINWVDESRWNGFGSKLPFKDKVFDMVFFSCGDPYIPEPMREYVYKDIYRILKPGGSAGVIAWGYPDRQKRHIQNKWIRKGIYIHDFAESVCKGWHGFRDIGSTISMAKDIGFVGLNAVVDNYYMLDSAIWVFKRP